MDDLQFFNVIFIRKIINESSSIRDPFELKLETSFFQTQIKVELSSLIERLNRVKISNEHEPFQKLNSY